ncbi:MAG TPA: nodulation protein NfeD [Miltoncostaeaceae bacterium]|nr:nodulation protein NfeD [Miltoncostaeaceae bacterium]
MTPTLRALLCGLLMALAAAALLAPGPAAGQGAEPAPVRVIELDGSIDPATAVFVDRRIGSAEDARAAAIVIRLDTPGGAISSMRDIVSDMQAAEVPVTVWVGPSGARAGSAGAFIAAASDQLGMAPGTNIGSATPIGSGGEDLEAKVRNDAAAFIAALADETGRNAESYRAMVTDASNLTAEEAVDQDVADTIQPTLESFVAWLDGQPGREGAIETTGAPIETDALPWYLRVLQALTDPNLVFFLLLVGLAGVGFEIFHPGAIVPAVVGAICLLLALAGLAVLPFQWTGIALLALAVALFIAETQVAGFGALALGGVVALALGGAFLFDSDDPALEPSVGVIVATAAVVGGGFAVAAHLVLRARRQPSRTGGAELVGEVGRARGAIGPGGGSVLVNGEIWSARAGAGVEIPAGREVRVVTVHRDDLTLTVEPREG